MSPRPPRVHHATSLPLHFFGRDSELALLDDALAGGAVSLVAFVGPGGQGKTAIVQHWLEPFLRGTRHADGVFLWSFYRGKDADVCLRELYTYAAGVPAGDVSATYCVDHLLPVPRRERWALVLDGVEVVQHESGPWFGRVTHPELGRLLEELASEPLPGVVMMLGQYEEALAAYREADAALRGDALLALGRLGPLLDCSQMPHPWNTLWQTYRAHALCLAGRTAEGTALAATLVPQDVYEWLHVFECFLRAGRLDVLDLRSLLYRPPYQAEHRWAELARQRRRADYLRVRSATSAKELGPLYETLLEAYDRSGMPLERAVTRQGYARWLGSQGRWKEAGAVNAVTLELAGRHRLAIVGADAWNLAEEIARREDDSVRAAHAAAEAACLRAACDYGGPARP